jgi:adenylosuccinate lyase
LDLEAIKNEYKVNRNSVMPIVNGLRRTCENGYGEYVHYGATTQDVIDTGEVLEIKQMLAICYRDLRKVEAVLIVIAEKHCETAMIGRTHGQYAIPFTFGLKVAVWIKEVRRHIERIKFLKSHVLIGQLSGAVGTKAAFGSEAGEISKKVLNKLGLDEDTVSWHTSRDNINEVCACFTMITGTAAKIANEVFQLGRTDIMELKESSKKTMSSSTMPHKSNPVLCERVVVLFKHVRALLGVTLESMVHENERDPRSLWAEWLAFPQISIYTGTALNYIITILEGMEVNTENMKSNLYKFKDFVVSEYLQFKLGQSIGKMNAQEKLHQLIQSSQEQGISLKELLKNDLEVSNYFSENDFDVIDHPEQYIGQAKEMVQTVLTDIKEKRKMEPEI